MAIRHHIVYSVALRSLCYLALIVCIIRWFISSDETPSEPWPEGLAAQVEPSVVPIYVSYDPLSEEFQTQPLPRRIAKWEKGFVGSGCFVGRLQGNHDRVLVLTAWHVVDNFFNRQHEPNARIVIVTHDREVLMTTRVLCRDRQRDLALLSFPVTDQSITSASVAEKEPSAGDVVMASGYPECQLTSSETQITSRVISRHFDRYTPSFHLDRVLLNGFSGGPIWDRNGQIVGVIWGRCETYSVATALSSIHEFLISNRLQYLIDRDLSLVETSQHLHPLDDRGHDRGPLSLAARNQDYENAGGLCRGCTYVSGEDVRHARLNERKTKERPRMGSANAVSFHLAGHFGHRPGHGKGPQRDAKRNVRNQPPT